MNQKLKMIFSPSMLTCIWDLLTKYLPTYLWVAITRPNKQCWLITERPTDARDNGYVLFKWLCQNHPEKNVIYAIRTVPISIGIIILQPLFVATHLGEYAVLIP